MRRDITENIETKEVGKGEVEEAVIGTIGRREGREDKELKEVKEGKNESIKTNKQADLHKTKNKSKSSKSNKNKVPLKSISGHYSKN